VAVLGKRPVVKFRYGQLFVSKPDEEYTRRVGTAREADHHVLCDIRLGVLT
jgi:hypothetical protein